MIKKDLKIGFTGTMSVGKTTLVEALAKLDEFKTYKIATERSKYLRDLGIPLDTTSSYLGQTVFAAERASELLHNGGLITDRTIIDVSAFTSLSNDMGFVEKNRLINAHMPLVEEYDYIFYISPDGIPIEDNGVRETDEKYRKMIDDEIKSLLNKFDVEYTEISGSTEDRIKTILNIIK